MNILHVNFDSFYMDGGGYQDNLLPKWQKRLGHDVTYLTTNMSAYPNGQIKYTENESYFDSDGVRIVRVKPKSCLYGLLHSFQRYEIGTQLIELKPDFIMIHGLRAFESLQIIKYKKRINKKCVLIADSHTDDHNTSLPKTFRGKIRKCICDIKNKYVCCYYETIYGTSPARIEHLIHYWKVPKNKTDLLSLGCDDDLVYILDNDSAKFQIQKKYGISRDDLLFISGARIRPSKNIKELIEAISLINNDGIKVLVFGDCIDNNYQRELEHLADSSSGKIRLIGNLSQKEIHELYSIAHLAIFPGDHSVLWEQAVGSGVPILVRRWFNMEYLDLGGNVMFLEHGDAKEIKESIEKILLKGLLVDMKKVAEKLGMEKFSYQKQAANLIRKHILEEKL